jgi:putative DNA primase/helicase
LIDLNDAAPPAPALRYDLDAIAARLRDTAHAWVPRLFPNGRRQGDEWRLANIQGAPPRQSGSCVIMLAGDHAGDWHDFDGGQGGGPFNTLEHGTGLSGRMLFAEAAARVGWTGEAPARQEPPPARKPDRDMTHEIGFVREHAQPIADTPAAQYLQGRGLAVPPDADLLFHPDLTNFETKAGYLAMIGLVRDVAGEVIALHRTYLQQNGETVRKADVPKPRMMLGKVGGGAVRLAPIGPHGVLGLCEGIETGLAVMAACPGLPVWATLSTSGLEQVQLPPEAQRIIILADHDASGAGMRAADALAGRLRRNGMVAAIAAPPQQGDDFNDMLGRDGHEAIATLVDAALRAAVTPPPAAEDETGRHLPLGFLEPTAPLPMLRADEGNLRRATDRAWSAILASNRAPWLFRLGGLPSWVTPDDEGRPIAATVSEERLRHMLAKLADWRKVNSKGDAIPAPPPTGVVKSLLATPDPGLPILAGIVTTPVFGRGGVLLTEPGYHPDARLLYRPTAGFRLPPVPDRPTAQDIAAARSLLLDDLLGDFPFTSTAERAHALCLLLLSFLRAMIDGPTPLHLIEKPTPGTGATLMVDVIATVLTGVGASVMTEGRDDEEWRKRITAKLRQIPSLILIDNLREQLDSSALAAALTAPFWEDRILGQSDMTRLPIRCAWVATGNNPTFSNEMARRLVRIRLDAHTDQPWRRESFRHPDLMVWVRANRGRLVAACLTLCQAWIVAGRPRGGRSIGSYEIWAQTLGGVLEVGGIEGFLGNLDEMMAASDSEGGAWRAFVQTWWDRFGTAEVSASDLFGHAKIADPPLPISAKDENGQRVRLGLALRKLRDRAFRISDRMVHIRAGASLHNAQRWRLAPAATDDPGQPYQPSPPSLSDVRVGPPRLGLDTNPNTATVQEFAGVGEGCEGWEGFSTPHTCAHAHARMIKDGAGKPYQPSPNPDLTWVSGGEGSKSTLPTLPAPSWLDGVP